MSGIRQDDDDDGDGDNDDEDGGGVKARRVPLLYCPREQLILH